MSEHGETRKQVFFAVESASACVEVVSIGELRCRMRHADTGNTAVQPVPA